MHNSQPVKVLDPIQQLHHDRLGLLDGWEAVFGDVAIEGDRVKFQNNVGGVVAFIDRLHLAQVGVTQLRHDLELVEERLLSD